MTARSHSRTRSKTKKKAIARRFILARARNVDPESRHLWWFSRSS